MGRNGLAGGSDTGLRGTRGSAGACAPSGAGEMAAGEAAEWTWTATYTGDLGPACGHVVRLHSTVRGTAVAVIESGKIKRFTDYYDMASFCRKPSASKQ